MMLITSTTSIPNTESKWRSKGHPPAGTLDLGVEVKVVERDEHGPSRVSGFGEQFPSDDEEEEVNHPNHAEVPTDEGVNEGRFVQVHDFFEG